MPLHPFTPSNAPPNAYHMAAPFRTDVTVPLDVTSLTLAARAEDVDGNATTAASVIAVGADDNTTVTERVLDGTNGNAPVEAVVDVFTCIGTRSGGR